MKLKISTLKNRYLKHIFDVKNMYIKRGRLLSSVRSVLLVTRCKKVFHPLRKVFALMIHLLKG